MDYFTLPHSEPVFAPGRTYCTSPCGTASCNRRLSDAILDAARRHADVSDGGPTRLIVVDLRCPAFTRDPAPAALLRGAVSDSMEEAELFGDMTADERREAMAWLDRFPSPVVSAIGRAFIKALKEIQ